MKAIKKNLEDQTITGNHNVIMFCPQCGAEFSANAGDYWNCADDFEFKCCGRTMELVTKHTIYQAV